MYGRAARTCYRIFGVWTIHSLDTISDYSKSQGDILKIYRRDQYEGDKEATISAGVVTFGSVTIDLGDTSLNSLDVLNVEYAII